MAAKPGSGATGALLLLFFLSGATSLTYQVLWVRELQLVFGTSTFAISTVLAAFMGGLALGGFAMARYADRLSRPLAAYGILEGGIGLYALGFPWLVAGVTPVYLDVWRAMQPGPVVFGSIQFVLVGSTLLLPTAAMGATLPLLARFSIRHLDAVGNRIGTLYSVNTFGAAVGTWLCGFVLLPHVGRLHTTRIAVAANLLLGLGALVLNHLTPTRQRIPIKDKSATVSDRRLLIPVSIALGLAGFSVLVYEVAWARLLGLILGGSTYTFSLMLFVFLTGMALGGKLGGRLADRLLEAGGRARLLLAFATIEVAIAVLSYATMYLYPELPFWYVWLFDMLNASHNPEAVWWVSIAVAGLVMAPPTVLMGMHFPVAVRAVVASEDTLGGPVGVLYGASTLGGVLGAFTAGFALLPVIWMQGTIFVAALAGLLAAGLLVFYATRGARQPWFPAASVGLVAVVLGLLFVAQRPPWNPLLMTAGLYHYVGNFDDHSRAGIRQFSVDLYDLLFYEEGLTSVVTVARNKGSSHLWLANNGKVDASTTSDLPTQVLLSALPMQFVDAPEDVLIVGVASGISAGTASRSPEVRRLALVEIEPAIERAAAFFSAWNRNVLSDPRAEVIHNDARNHLLLTGPGRYDIVVSEPSNPWISGVANLFTKEFLQLGKTRLKPGGVWSQWIQMYGMDSLDLQSMLRTFADVYPHVLVYASMDPADLVVIGSEAPLDLMQERTMRLLEHHGLTADLVRVGVRSNIEMASLFLMDRSSVMTMTEGSPLNTDDNMLIEYSAPLNLHRDTRRENLEMLMEHASLPDGALGSNASQWRRLAQIYQQRRDAVRYRSAMNRAMELDAQASP
jgi:spermidine synthase